MLTSTPTASSGMPPRPAIWTLVKVSAWTLPAPWNWSSMVDPVGRVSRGAPGPRSPRRRPRHRLATRCSIGPPRVRTRRSPTQTGTQGDWSADRASHAMTSFPRRFLIAERSDMSRTPVPETESLAVSGRRKSTPWIDLAALGRLNGTSCTCAHGSTVADDRERRVNGGACGDCTPSEARHAPVEQRFAWYGELSDE